MPLQHNNSNTDEITTGSITTVSTGVTTGARDGDSIVAVQITGTWAGTFVFQGTVDGTNWVTVFGRSLTSPVLAATTTVNGLWRFSVGGLNQFRVFATAFSSGTAVVTVRQSNGSSLGGTELAPTTLSTANAAAAGIFAGVSSYGYLRATGEPSALFNDCFEGATLDTVNRWDAVTQTGSGSVSLFGGTLSLGISSATNSKAAAFSRPTFGSNTGLGFLAWGCLVALESGSLVTNTHRFWGLGAVDGSWAYNVSQVYNGIGFEVLSTGVFRACVYQGGVASFSQILTAPTDGALHRYGVVFRNDVAFWYQDTTEYPVASLQLYYPAFPNLPFLGDVSVLPIRYHCISGGATPSGSTSMAVSAVGVGDTSHSNAAISDGTFPWRKASVTPGGALRVSDADATFGYSIMQTAIATANNKSMISVWNISTTYIVRIHAIWLINTQVSAVTGVSCRFALRRLTGSAPSAGTDISATAVEKMDSLNPTFSTHATARTGATVGTESTIPIQSHVWYTEENVVGTINVPMHERLSQLISPFFGKMPGASVLLLRNAEGITVKCETSTTTGSFDIRMLVSLEPAS